MLGEGLMVKDAGSGVWGKRALMGKSLWSPSPGNPPPPIPKNSRLEKERATPF